VESEKLQVDTNAVFLKIAAGEIWDDAVKYAVKENLWGIENLSYIPGTVGATPVQNIGAYGMELSNVLESVRAYDMITHSFIALKNSECEFGYRDSLFKKNNGRYIITQTVLKLSTIPNPILNYKPLDSLQDKKDISLQEIRDLVIKTRTSKLPDYTQYPNAGSFFKNPTITSHQVESLKVKGHEIPAHIVAGGYKVPAAWLIEHIAEMKGVRTGDVGSWPAQPLVLVNYGNATADGLINFSQSIIDTVREKTGIILEREVNVVFNS
jgi:UDP-N-acetylmuramate dehydrogenase